MAVRVFECDRQRIESAAYANMISMPFLVSQSFSALGDGTGRSAAFNASTRFIVIQADEKVAVRVGSGAPIAAATDYVIEAGGERTIWVNPGHVVAARTL